MTNTHTRLAAATSIIAGAVLLAGATALPRQAPADASYLASVESWRAKQETALRADNGWLTVVGLVWLHEGDNPTGSGEGNDVRLPAGSAPDRVGAFEFASGVITFVPAPGATVTVNGQPAARQVIRSEGRSPDMVRTGTVTMFIIKRGDRYGVRIRDANAETRREFQGRKWFPVQPALRVTARFVPHAKPTTILIANVLGDLTPLPTPGYAEFTLDGQTLRLSPVLENPNSRQLFFILKDATAGSDTYGAGRFLYTGLPERGELVLDFNKAENPPCAFTAFATCPLPPRENVLPIRIEAGERTPH